MSLAIWILGIALGLLWLVSLVRGLFGLRTIADLTHPQWDAPLHSAPCITVIVPARNEAEKIASCLSSLLALDYPDL